MWGKKVQRRLRVDFKIFGFKNKIHLKLLISGESMLLHHTEGKKYINTYTAIKYIIPFFFSPQGRKKEISGISPSMND